MKRNVENPIPEEKLNYTVQFSPRNNKLNMSNNNKEIRITTNSGPITVKKVVQDISKILENLIDHLHLIERKNDSFSDVIPKLEQNLKKKQNLHDTKTHLRESHCSLKLYNKEDVRRINTERRIISSNKRRAVTIGIPKLSENFKQRNALYQGQSAKKMLNCVITRRETYDPLGPLKEEVQRAINEEKIFTVRGGDFHIIRRALLNRGWVEKIHFLSYRDGINKQFRTFRHYSIPQLISLLRIHELTDISKKIIQSKLLVNHQVDLYWGVNGDAFKECPDKVKLTKINMFKKDIMCYITRQCLCTAFKNPFWFVIPGISNLHHPRTYSLLQNVDTTEFIIDFNITASMSLLKWVVRNSITQECKIMSPSGKIPITTFDFAVNECYKFIKMAKNEGSAFGEAPEDEWSEFLENFYKVVHSENHFKLDNTVTEMSMIRKSNYILSQLKELWPYLEMDGIMNIWILKSANSKQELGFHIVHKLDYVLNIIQSNPNHKYIIQKYIERPLLIHGTRFDIRQWFLISNSAPLSIWIYKHCFLRFTVYRTGQNPNIFLPKRSCEKDNTDFAIPTCNMWDSNQFKNYLSDIGYPNAFNEIIYDGMQQCIKTSILIQQNKLDQRDNCFKLCSADFILTEDFKPWLLKINDNLVFKPSTPLTVKMFPMVLEDVIRVVVDYERNNKACTGGFELIYEEEVPNVLLREARIVKRNPTESNYFYTPPLHEIYNFLGKKAFTSNLNNIVEAEAADCIKQIGKGIKKTLKDLLPLLTQKNVENRSIETILPNEITESRETQTKREAEMVNLQRVKNTADITDSHVSNKPVKYEAEKNIRSVSVETITSMPVNMSVVPVNTSHIPKWSKKPSESFPGLKNKNEHLTKHILKSINGREVLSCSNDKNKDV